MSSCAVLVMPKRALLRTASKPRGSASTRVLLTTIGLHNLGEGLAIGGTFAAGSAGLRTFLLLGFVLHNVTEGIGIAAPRC